MNDLIIYVCDCMCCLNRWWEDCWSAESCSARPPESLSALDHTPHGAPTAGTESRPPAHGHSAAPGECSGLGVGGLAQGLGLEEKLSLGMHRHRSTLCSFAREGKSGAIFHNLRSIFHNLPAIFRNFWFFCMWYRAKLWPKLVLKGTAWVSITRKCNAPLQNNAKWG